MLVASKWLAEQLVFNGEPDAPKIIHLFIKTLGDYEVHTFAGFRFS